MENLPHHYSVAATAQAESPVVLSSEALPELESAAPRQFGGPGDRWSPETLLVAAVADCFILSFRAIARASKLTWTSLECRAEGTLDRVDRVTQFTAFRVHALLHVPAGVSEDQARRILEKAERSCLISNSLKAPSHLETEVRIGG